MESGRADRRAFVSRLKDLRALNGMMTQEELAEESGVDVGLIQNYEQEKSLAREDAVAKMAMALGISPAGFLAIRIRDLFDSDGANQVNVVAQVLFQIASAYDLEPYYDGKEIGVKGNGSYIEYSMTEWADVIEDDLEKFRDLYEDGISEEERAKREVDSKYASETRKRFELGYDGPFDEMDYPVQPPRLGETMRRLRAASGLTQADLAEAAGVSVFTVRAYEQGKRTPNDEQRIAMAKALGVPAEVLLDFGITNPNEAFHYLMEIAHVFYLTPKRVGERIVLVNDVDLRADGLPARPNLEKLFGEWYFAWVEFRESGDVNTYQNWQDHYEG